MFSIPPIKRFVERLEQDRPEGWRDAAEVALELSLPELVLTKLIIQQMSRITLEDQAYAIVAVSDHPATTFKLTYLNGRC